MADEAGDPGSTSGEHAQPVEAAARQQVVHGADGPSTTGAPEHPRRHGTSRAGPDAPPSRLRAILRRYRSPRRLVLLAAGIVSFLVPDQAPVGAVLLGLTVLEAWLAVAQAGPVSMQLTARLDGLAGRVLGVAGIALAVALIVDLARGPDIPALLLTLVAFAAATVPAGLPAVAAAIAGRAERARHATGLLATSAFGFIAAVLGASVMTILGGTPLMPLQILWVGGTVDVLQGIGLGHGWRPGAGDETSSAPAPPPLLPWPELAWYAIAGLVMAVDALALAVYAANTWGPAPARTMAVVTLALLHLWFSLATANPARPILAGGLVENTLRLRLTLVSAIVIFMTASLGPLERILGTVDLALDQWLLCIAVSLSIVVVAAVRKALGLGVRDEGQTTPASPTPAGA